MILSKHLDSDYLKYLNVLDVVDSVVMHRDTKLLTLKFINGQCFTLGYCLETSSGCGYPTIQHNVHSDEIIDMDQALKRAKQTFSVMINKKRKLTR